MTTPTIAGTMDHPVDGIDLDMAAQAMSDWMTGTPVHWDPAIARHRPEVIVQGPLVARDMLAAMRGEPEPDHGPDTRRVRPLSGRDASEIREWAAMRAVEKRRELRDIPIPQDGRIEVQRLLACAAGDLLPALGIFWTTDIWHGGILTAPWGTGGGEILLTARVHVDDVDWATSCLTRMDWHSGDYEKELRLRPGRPLSHVRAESWDQSLIRRNGRGIVIPDLDWTT